LGIILIYTSCSTRKIYTPALFHDDISYLPKPTSGDSLNHQTYFSGTYGGSSGFNNTNQITFYQADASQGWIFKNFNLAYGGYAVLGNVDNSSNTIDSVKRLNPGLFDSKGFSALGARLSMNFYQRSGRTDIRVLGFEASYSHEMGDYSNFRKQVGQFPDYYTTTMNDLFTLGASTEIILEGRRHPYNKFGFRLFGGQTFGNFNFLNYTDKGFFHYGRLPIYLNYAFFLQIQKVFLVADYNSYLISGDLPSLHLRIGYHF